MVTCKLLEVKGLPSFSSDGKDDRYALIIAIPGKTLKSSVPVLSAAKPKVFLGVFAFLANCLGVL